MVALVADLVAASLWASLMSFQANFSRRSPLVQVVQPVVVLVELHRSDRCFLRRAVLCSEHRVQVLRLPHCAVLSLRQEALRRLLQIPEVVRLVLRGAMVVLRIIQIILAAADGAAGLAARGLAQAQRLAVVVVESAGTAGHTADRHLMAAAVVVAPLHMAWQALRTTAGKVVAVVRPLYCRLLQA